MRAAAPTLHLLDRRRDHAERVLNGVRAGVLVALGIAALVYAPSLTPTLNRVNVLVLAPMLAWTVAQWALLYRRAMLPPWLPVLNPLADITAVTVILGGYALAQSAALAVKTPMFLAYFVILAALPIAAATRTAALVTMVAAAEYAALVTSLIATGSLPIVASPVAASARPSVSPLDEGAKLLLLLIAGAVATYATHWQEELARAFSRATEEREQLGARLERAQLQALKLQLHPHFLFNALNTITALVHANPNAAERMVSALSELLRASLSNASEQELPLAREIEVLGYYLEIQRIRFQDRLTVDIDLARGTDDALVPNLLLQPLVENAIRHGIAPRAAPGHVRITVAREGDALVIGVEDDGIGEAIGRTHRDGVGLGNTRARLHALYGTGHRFEAGGRAGGGFAVRIEIPFRATHDDEPAERMTEHEGSPATPLARSTT